MPSSWLWTGGRLGEGLEIDHRELWAEEPAVLVLMQNDSCSHFHRVAQLTDIKNKQSLCGLSACVTEPMV